MVKKHLDKNVYDASIERIEFIYENFDNVYIAFSGGKDSGVLVHLCAKYLKDNNINKKLNVAHLDYEAQYSATTEYVESIYEEYKKFINVYHICVPFKVTTCTSMFQSFWRPWEDDKEEIWVRNKPTYALSHDQFSFFNENMWDYEFQEKLSQWIHEKEGANKTAVLVGIRTQESLNRWRTIHKDRKSYFDEKKYSKKIAENIYNFYPIYDWKTSDIWVANAKLGFSYNKLYDLYYYAGLPIESMRVASPFLSEAQDTLKLYKVIEPEVWGKMIGRVNGVNFTALYGGTTATGWRNIDKPDNYTWEEYMYFLLSTLPNDVKSNYLEKLNTSIKFWKEKGGVLSDETIRELDELGVKYEIGEHNYKTPKKAVKIQYLDDIDINDFSLIPTFKRMCICIMKNDHLCKYMGFAQNKIETAKRKEAIKKYENIL